MYVLSDVPKHFRRDTIPEVFSLVTFVPVILPKQFWFWCRSVLVLSFPAAGNIFKGIRT
jgi:hypothetical protein